MKLPEILEALYKTCRNTLKDNSIENPDFEARRILEKRGAISWSDIIAYPNQPVPAEILEAVQGDLEKRLSGMPLSRIYGERQFWGLNFMLSSATLDPRPETELIIEVALDIFRECPPARVLDLGTGTGCLAITLATLWPEAEIMATDVSREALVTAKANAEKHGVEKRMRFVCANWAQEIEGQFDLVVSNPPYIAESVIPSLAAEVRNHDPILALSGGKDGLDAYKKIFSALNRLLTKQGAALLEIGFDQAESVVRLVEESKLLIRNVHQDLSNHPRVVEIRSGDN